MREKTYMETEERNAYVEEMTRGIRSGGGKKWLPISKLTGQWRDKERGVNRKMDREGTPKWRRGY